jgi:hypothetical protein
VLAGGHGAAGSSILASSESADTVITSVAAGTGPGIVPRGPVTDSGVSPHAAMATTASINANHRIVNNDPIERREPKANSR